MSKYLSKEQILQAKDLQSEEVEVPEWGGTVIVRGMTGTQRGRFYSILSKSGKTLQEDSELRLVSLCLVDGEGNPLFTEKELAELGKKSGSAINRVSQVALRLCGFTKDDLEEIKENFAAAQNGDSGSS